MPKTKTKKTTASSRRTGKTVSKRKTAKRKTGTKKTTPKKPKTSSRKAKTKTSSSQKAVKQSPRKRDILKIKLDLLRQREDLLKEAEGALNSLPGEINFPDMGDQATAETDRNFMLRLRDRERMLLKKIEDAIERIENDTFGICESCDEEIGIKRLEARPVTTLCIECKTKQEEEERMAEGT